MLKKENTDTKIKKKLRYFTLNRDIQLYRANSKYIFYY